MEYRDLYNKDRNLTGKTISKGEPIPKGYYIKIVVASWKIVKENF